MQPMRVDLRSSPEVEEVASGVVPTEGSEPATNPIADAQADDERETLINDEEGRPP